MKNAAGRTVELGDCKREGRDLSILESIPNGILLLASNGSISFANRAARDLLDIDDTPPALARLLRPADGESLDTHLARTSPFEAIFEAPYFDRHLMVSVSKSRISGDHDLVLCVTDITPLKQANARIEFLAHHDALTGLGNRTLLKGVWDGAEEKLAEGRGQVHALALDLDHFKQINDLHGHAIGDLVLRQVADRLRALIGAGGHMFRFGGDEFFALLHDVPQEMAVRTAERIVADLGRPFEIQGLELRIGCSIGIASAPNDGLLRDQIHRAADMALYEVKRNGRGAVACFDAGQEHVLLQQRLLQTDLVLAIANESFDLVFQPQIDTGTREVHGAEALLRWNNPRLGRLVPPAEFIPIAEQMGLMHLIDMWVVRNAIPRFARLVRAGWPGSSLSINVGTNTLLREDMGTIFVETLRAHGLSPGQIEVEIAERAAMLGGPPLQKAIGRLRDLGLRIVIDDFAAGRGDFDYLRALGVERIKLDRSLTDRMIGNAEASAVVGAVWALCRELGLELTAEGVETAEQWGVLQTMGRMRAQGFFLGHPEGSEKLLDRLQAANGSLHP